jgi:hypothetical protein
VHQGLFYGNFKCTQDVLGYLSKVKGMHESRESFRTTRGDYAGEETNRKSQPDNRRDDGPRNRRQNVIVRFVRRQTDRRRPNFNERRQNIADDGEFYGRSQGRAVGNNSGRLYPDVLHF